MITIMDGTGTSTFAKVSSNRLFTDSVQRSEILESAFDGNAFNINTGTINLTSSNKSAVLYVKNNETKDLVVEAFIYLIGNSTGGSGDMIISVLRNPTEGTIVSDATSVSYKGNRNFGSAKTLQADQYKGDEGLTFTDGDVIIESIFNQAPTRSFISGDGLTLPSGSSIGIEITPASGNTSVNCQFALPCYLRG